MQRAAQDRFFAGFQGTESLGRSPHKQAASEHASAADRLDRVASETPNAVGRPLPHSKASLSCRLQAAQSRPAGWLTKQQCPHCRKATGEYDHVCTFNPRSNSPARAPRLPAGKLVLDAVEAPGEAAVEVVEFPFRHGSRILSQQLQHFGCSNAEPRAEFLRRVEQALLKRVECHPFDCFDLTRIR